LTGDEFRDVSEAEAAIRRLTVGGLIPSVDLLQTLIGMRINGTTDGLPYVEPPLTDEDARARPWVMVRDGYAGGWHGPARLAIVNGGLFHIMEMPSNLVTRWRFARRATPEEIAAAGLEVAE
jgi:hypothetical protein